MAIFEIGDAKRQISHLIERAHAGEEIVLVKAGKPYAKLVAMDRRPTGRPLRLGQFKHLIPPIPDSAFFDPLPEEELRRWQEP